MGVEAFDEELDESVRELVAIGEIERDSAAHGIARKVIYEGYDRLTFSQRAMYNAYVVPALRRRAAEIEAIQLDNRWPRD